MGSEIKKVRHGYSGDLVTMSLIRSKVASVHVYGLLHKNMDIKTNKVTYSQKEIAELTGKTPSQISKAIHTLKDGNIIRAEAGNVWFLNPYVFFMAEFDNDDDEWMNAFNGDDVVYPTPMHEEWGEHNWLTPVGTNK